MLTDTMMENDLATPFSTEVLGAMVTVERVAVCKRGGKRQRISILDLPLPSPPPKGAEWIAAYRHWRPTAPNSPAPLAQSGKEYWQGRSFGPFNTHGVFSASLHWQTSELKRGGLRGRRRLRACPTKRF